MSRNDQLLVKEHKGKFLVFDVMAETWCGYDEKTESIDENKINHLDINRAKGSFNTREEAHTFAHKLDSEDSWGGSEYGVVDEVLYKDGAKVTIKD